MLLGKSENFVSSVEVLKYVTADIKMIIKLFYDVIVYKNSSVIVKFVREH